MGNANDGEHCGIRRGVTRRDFIGSLSSGVIGVTVAHRLEAPPAEEVIDEPKLANLTLLINNERHAVSIEARTTLLSVLRNTLGMTGTKLGCERGECGACTVLVDGTSRYSCLTLAVEVEGRDITTVEGLLRAGKLGSVQQAFLEEDAFQCGYCTPGQIMAAEGLLRQNPNPTTEEIREGMSGNLCRCGAYQHIFRAVRRASELKRGGAA